VEPPTLGGSDDGITTVRCQFPEEAAATLRLAGEGRAATGAVPTTLAERFEDRGQIARGGMSSVRTVFDRVILREMAMKVLAPERTLDELSRFIEEAQITGQLDHPNIVPVHDIEMDEKGLPTRFTMKLVRGHTLHEYLSQRADRDLSASELEELLRVFIKVCDAIAFAHSRGVIHRDLKPGNIMVGTHGQVYVMDWGIALLRAGTRPSENLGSLAPVQLSAPATLPESPGTLSGTPSFMAPEQAHARLEQIDERTDVYGLGGILYAILTQHPPHDGNDVHDDLRLARIGEVRPPHEVAPNRHLPPLLCRIAMKALAPEQRDRYASVNELKTEVEGFLRGGGWFAQKRFAPGTVIVREGDDADAAYIITAGQCELSREVDGQKQFVRLLAPGDVFGETAIFGSSKRTATIVAHTEVSALVVTRDALERELDRSLWLRAFVEAVAERYVELDRTLRRITSQPPKVP
jgi:serine/threonine-protein kinase